MRSSFKQCRSLHLFPLKVYVSDSYLLNVVALALHPLSLQFCRFFDLSILYYLGRSCNLGGMDFPSFVKGFPGSFRFLYASRCNIQVSAINIILLASFF